MKEKAEPNDRFGCGLAVGDFDGDGVDDLAIGAANEVVEWPPANFEQGTVNVLYGGRPGLSSADNQLWSQNSPDVEGETEAEDAFGYTLAAGDFNGDGFSDLAIGVPIESLPLAPEAGAVNVIYGSAGGLSAVAVPEPAHHKGQPGRAGNGRQRGALRWLAGHWRLQWRRLRRPGHLGGGGGHLLQPRTEDRTTAQLR